MDPFRGCTPRHLAAVRQCRACAQIRDSLYPHRLRAYPRRTLAACKGATNTSDGGTDMTEGKARHIVLAARLHGRPQPSDFRLEDTAIPMPRAGQVLLRVQYLSLDPYMRGQMDDRKSYAKPVPLGGV